MAQADLAVSRLLSRLKRGDLAIMGKVVAIAVVAVIVVAGVSYFVGHGVLVTGDARSVANVALQSAGKHALDYDSVLKLTSSARPSAQVPAPASVRSSRRRTRTSPERTRPERRSGRIGPGWAALTGRSGPRPRTP